MQWRCGEQEQGIRAIMSGSMEIIVVLPTGMGKSLLFQLPCSLPGAKTTILVFPLVVLRFDMLRRSREIGIDCADWSVNRQTRASLVVMSVESAVSDSGRQYLHELYYAGQLERIVVDECHTSVTESDYRPLMARLALLRRLPVQFVYLTATLPPSLRDSFIERHHLVMCWRYVRLLDVLTFDT